MADGIESTGFVETNMILDLLRDDLVAAQGRIAGMGGSELSELRLTAITAVDLIDEEFRARKRRQQGGGSSR